MLFVILLIGSYLLGSIPFGLIIAKAHGKDLRTIGSGNIGATNVARALGRRWAYLCFILDVLKGLLPMLAVQLFNTSIFTASYNEGAFVFWLWLVVGCAAILGHIFPIYLKFKGGKGVATSLGVALGLWPFYTICALFAIIASISFPLILILAIIITPDWKFVNLWPLIIVAVAIPVMVIILHRKNIKRLIEGTESKVLT
jgi:glycerol-3-phosphate acyltransferase PlsY